MPIRRALLRSPLSGDTGLGNAGLGTDGKTRQKTISVAARADMLALEVQLIVGHFTAPGSRYCGPSAYLRVIVIGRVMLSRFSNRTSMPTVRSIGASRRRSSDNALGLAALMTLVG